jgi:hypothetical protein
MKALSMNSYNALLEYIVELIKDYLYLVLHQPIILMPTHDMT